MGNWERNVNTIFRLFLDNKKSSRGDSNPWPTHYECAALPTEPRKQNDLVLYEIKCYSQTNFIYENHTLILYIEKNKFAMFFWKKLFFPGLLGIMGVDV